MQKFRKLRDDIRGMGAVEFALILPFIVALMLGGYELTQGINVDRKLTLVARTVADLAAQNPSDNITVNEMNNLILNAGKTVFTPYDQSKVQIVVSGVRVNNGGVAKVEWSTSTPNTTPRSTSGTPPLNTNLVVKNTSLIWAEITYPYTPEFGSAFTGTIDLKEVLFMRPRSQDCIKYNNVGCT